MRGRRTLVWALLAAACGAPAQHGGGASPPDPLDTVTAEQLYAQGVQLGRAGDLVRAEQYIAAAIDRGYPEERALPTLMAVCVEASRLSAALGYAEPFLARHPTHWPLRLLVASIYMGLDQHERARDELRRVLQDAPADAEPPEAHYFLGVLHRDRFDDLETAREHFRRYLALAPDGPHRHEALAALPPEESGLPRRVPSGAEHASDGAQGAGPQRVRSVHEGAAE